MRSWSSFVLLVACTKDPEPPPPPRPEPVPVPVKHSVDDPDRWFFVEQRGATGVAYVAIELSDDGKRETDLVKLQTQPALVHADRSIAAHAGNRLAIATAVAGGFEVTVREQASRHKFGRIQRVALAIEPHALHLAGEALYVGTERALGWVDLGSPKPAYVQLVERDQHYKAYDRFARTGDRLAAIDDQVVPMFAEWYALGKDGSPRQHAGDWTLPGVINGHYDHAALASDAATLVLVASYSIIDGHGHDLAAIPIRGDKLVFAPDLTLQNADGKTPILEEHTPRSSISKLKLFAGTAITPWTGLAVTPGNHVLIAAGERGLFRLPLDFTGATTPEVLALGDVRDIRVQGKLIVALTAAELVVLDEAGQVVAKHALPAQFDRFVE